MGQKNIFGGMFGRSVKISAGQIQMKFQNLGKCWVKFKKCALFLVKCNSRCQIMPKKTRFKCCM